jgi:hypothetical protein
MTLHDLRVDINKGAIIKRKSWQGNKCIWLVKGQVLTMATIRDGIVKKALLAGGKEKFEPTFISSHYDMVDGSILTVNCTLTDEEINANDWIIWER